MARRSFRRNSNLVNDYSDLYENGYSQYDEEYSRSSKYNDYDGDMRHLNRSSSHSRNKSSYKGSTGNTFKRFIIKQLVKLLLVVLLVIFTFLIIEATVTGDSIVDVYMSLTARVTQSNVNFDKRISFMSTDSEGNTTIQFGWKNEYTQSTGEVATDFAENNPGEPGTSGDNTPSQPSANLTGDSIEFNWPLTVWWLHNDGSLQGPVKTDKYYGLGKENTGDWYISKKWKYQQGKLHDYITAHMDRWDNSDSFATFDGYPLTALGQYWGNSIGCVVRVEFNTGDVVDMLVVDAKSNGDPYPRWPNASAFFDDNQTQAAGHFYVEKESLAITEMICTSATYAAFNLQFGTNLGSGTKVIKITVTDKKYID